MAAFECPKCHNQRSPRRDMLCNICYLLEDLVEEHHDGFHNEKPNPSCDICKPRHNRMLAESGAAAYIKRVTAPALDERRARYLLKANTEGISFFARYGPAGSRVMLKLRDEGHLSISWFEGVPTGFTIPAHSLARALDVVASSQHTSDTPSVRQRRSERPKKTSQRVAMSHADCKHERSAKARAKCRAERAADVRN